jgi:hypothetical protein
MVDGMLSDFRFVFGAIMATTVLGVATFGVMVSLRLAREAHVTPIEGSRPMAYTNPGDWSHFYDATGAQRGDGAGRRPGAAGMDVPPASLEPPGPPLVIVPETIDPAPVPDPATDTRTAALAPVAAEAVIPAAPNAAPAPDTQAPADRPADDALVAAEARTAAVDRERPVEPGTPRAGVIPAPAAPTAAATDDAAAVKPADGSALGADAPFRESTVAVARATAADPATEPTEATGAIRPPADASEPTPPAGDRVANIAPVSEDPTAAPGQDAQPPAARARPRARKAATKAKQDVKDKVAKINAGKGNVPKVRVARVRTARERVVVEEPHALTGYSITVPRAAPLAAPRPRNPGVQIGGSDYQN